MLLRRIAIFLSVLLLASASGFAQMTAEQRLRNLASFDQVWNTVREKTWDPSFGGVNWQAVRDELRPKIEAARTDAEVRAVMADMLSRLHLTHYGVIPGSVYRDVENAGGAANNQDGSENEFAEQGDPGIHVRVIDALAVVVSVEPGSPAELAGVRPGWIIQRINDESLAPVLKRVIGEYSSSTLEEMMLSHSVLGRLDGPLMNAVQVDFLDGKDRPLSLTLARRKPRGFPEKFGFMPESWLWIDAEIIRPQIDYLAFNYFLDPVRLTTALQSTIESCPDCAGMIIDVRGNPGGIGILAMGLAGFFLDTPNLKLGTLQMRNLPMNFVVNPRTPSFHRPLAILIDGLSASTSEIFAGGLQDLKRARVFGSRSAGAALPSMFERLPNGDGFQFAMATYQSQSGKTLEGAGVIPDVAAPMTRAALLARKDPALDAAVEWIHQQTAKGTTSNDQ